MGRATFRLPAAWILAATCACGGASPSGGSDGGDPGFSGGDLPGDVGDAASGDVPAVDLSSADVGGGGWSQPVRLVAPDGVAGDGFGTSVAASGDTVIVGAPSRNHRVGAAYVFRRTGGAWSFEATLVPDDAVANEDLGTAVAVSGDVALVGAPEQNQSSFVYQTGAVYVFRRTGTAWAQAQKLVAADAQIQDYFGTALALDGDLAVIGAFGRGSLRGAAYVFGTGPAGFESRAELAPATVGTDWFGSAVALSGTTAVVGAHVQDFGAGAVDVYVPGGTGWALQQELLEPAAAQTDNFGEAVAVLGDTLAAGTPGRDGNTGAGTVFERAGTAWTAGATLANPSADAFGREFGFAVGLSGDRLAVGVPQSSEIDVFRRSGNGWVVEAVLPPPGGELGEYVGAALAFSGSVVVAGATGPANTGPDTGAAYVYSGP